MNWRWCRPRIPTLSDPIWKKNIEFGRPGSEKSIISGTRQRPILFWSIFWSIFRLCADGFPKTQVISPHILVWMECIHLGASPNGCIGLHLFCNLILLGVKGPKIVQKWFKNGSKIDRNRSKIIPGAPGAPKWPQITKGESWISTQQTPGASSLLCLRRPHAARGWY